MTEDEMVSLKQGDKIYCHYNSLINLFDKPEIFEFEVTKIKLVHSVCSYDGRIEKKLAYVHIEIVTGAVLVLYNKHDIEQRYNVYLNKESAEKD